MKKRILALVMAMAMVFALVACGSNDEPNQSETSTPSQSTSSDSSVSGDAENVLKIGALANQTGWFAVYDYNNVLEMQCLAKMYNDQGGIEIGGKKYMIEVVAEDGQSDVEGIRAAAQLLVDAGVDFVVETNDFWVEGALDIFEQAGILNIMAQNNMSFTTINENYKYTYTFSNGAAAQYAAAFELIKSEYPEVKKIVYCENDDGSAAAKQVLISGLCEEYGFEYVDSPVIYDAEATDFTAVALQLISTGADAFIGNSSVTNSGSILKELRNNGSDMIVACVIGSNASMLGEATGLSDVSNAFTMGSDLSNPENNTEIFNQLYNMFKEEYGEETAAAWSGVSVNCMYTLLQLLQAAGTTDVEEVIEYYNTIDSIESLFGTANICGTETYGVNHIVAHPNSTTKLENGEAVFSGWFECYVP